MEKSQQLDHLVMCPALRIVNKSIVCKCSLSWSDNQVLLYFILKSIFRQTKFWWWFSGTHNLLGTGLLQPLLLLLLALLYRLG